MSDLTPKSAKAEIHLSYRCNLSCTNCNRMSFLHQPHTTDMTLEDLTEFLDQARALDWYPALLLIGGEPTLHPDFYELCRACVEFAREGERRGLSFEGKEGLVQLWSNQLTAASRAACDKVRAELGVSVVGETIKTRSEVLSIDDMYVSPADMGFPVREACWQHASLICGISVDAGGYSPCASGGAIDGILGLGFRTKRLADLFDPEKVREITDRMCQHCGWQLSTIGFPGHATPDEWRALVAEQPRWRGMRVSPTWQAAYEGRT